MDVEKIMKMVDAGFTREEILNFAGEKPSEKPVEKPVEKSNENEALNNILQEMKNVVLEIQKANIFRASLPGPGEGDNVDSILASIINPRKENN